MASCPDRESTKPLRLVSSAPGDGEVSDPADRLIAAALPVFAQRGFDRATVREIAKEAGANVAAVSYYFGDKMGLYRAVIESIREQRQREFPAPAVGDAPAEETLLRLVRTLLSRMLAGDERGFEAMLMMREMQSPTAVFGVMVDEYFKPTFDALYATIEQLVDFPQADDRKSPGPRRSSSERGMVSSLHETLVSQVALGVVGQCLYYRIGRPVLEQFIAPAALAEHYDLESLCQHITASTLAACGRFDIIQERDRLERSSSTQNDRRIYLESNGRHEH